MGDKKNNTLGRMRRELRAQDNVDFELSDEFFNNLHDKIMLAVEQTEITPTPKVWFNREKLRSHVKSWLYPAGGILSVALSALLISAHMETFDENLVRIGLFSDGYEVIATRAALSPEGISQTLISSQLETDFFMDVASESFENLTVSKFNQIWGETL